ncbi:hypothetical protein LO763_22250 [Glycomyces sp. A-F 0318]|uniref:hypothetical protein n=1 Tax=Glycomyces amatae TaxID=2881355 RepID=UPI001E3C9784|nr:hypothetical protein [Glycomyces amatae]MCD0446340.1 hypothetical protein [Glycomyces amatae]
MNDDLPQLRRFLFPVAVDLPLSRAQTRARDLLAFACADAGLALECEPRWEVTESGSSREGLAIATAVVGPVTADEAGLSEAALRERGRARKIWSKSRAGGRKALIQDAFDADWTAAETARWFGVSVWEVCRYSWPATVEAGGLHVLN